MQGWGEKCLSRGGKAVLLRNVAQTIPTYAMSCFLLPRTLSEEMEKIMNKFWWGSGADNRKGLKWLSWANMSMSKSEGGMGFRDLYGFDLALLGKQCWNLIQNPLSLVGRLFKARYYPNNSFFEATTGGGVSFVWAGLWQAKEAFKKGYRWIIGDGRTIRITEDAWLRGKENHMVERVGGNQVAGEKVCDFFTPGERKWDSRRVSSSFQVHDAKLILATPIPKHQVCDRLSWPFATDGKYSVKSGYKYWHLNFSKCRRAVKSKGWGKLWRLNIPHKMKIFTWRLCRNNIPVRNSLRGKGVHTTIMCPMCDNDIEHCLHIFLDCCFAKACWNEMGLAIDAMRVENMSAWVLEWLSNESGDLVCQMITTLWGIWNARNSKVWDANCVNPVTAMQCSSSQVTQWQQTQLKVRTQDRNGVSQSGTKPSTKWVAPAVHRVKINVDAAVSPGIQAFSTGMVMRNSNSQFIRAQISKHAGEIPVLEAEVRGVLEALKWIEEMQLSNVDIETDSLLTV